MQHNTIQYNTATRSNALLIAFKFSKWHYVFLFKRNFEWHKNYRFQILIYLTFFLGKNIRSCSEEKFYIPLKLFNVSGADFFKCCWSSQWIFCLYFPNKIHYSECHQYENITQFNWSKNIHQIVSQFNLERNIYSHVSYFFYVSRMLNVHNKCWQPQAKIYLVQNLAFYYAKLNHKIMVHQNI